MREEPEELQDGNLEVGGVPTCFFRLSSLSCSSASRAFV